MTYRSTRSHKGSGGVAGFFGACLAIIVIWLILMAVVGFIFMVAWNAVMPEVFGLSVLDFGQSVALMVVASIILGAARTTVNVAKK